MRGQKLSKALREHIAENMKERVYASITLIAVIVALWQSPDHRTVVGAVASVGGTAVALWLATLISARVSHRAVYNKSMSAHELRKLLFTSSGLLAPAILPILLILLSQTGLFTLEYALLGGMGALVLSLFTLSFTTGRRIYPTLSRVLLISALETLVGVGVILLKLVIGK